MCEEVCWLTLVDGLLSSVDVKGLHVYAGVSCDCVVDLLDDG